MTEGFDWDEQRRETEWVWERIRSAGVWRPSGEYALDLQFLPQAPDADASAFAEELQAKGYDVSFYEDHPTTEATAPRGRLDLEIISRHEQATTEIALAHGFRPDGWGFHGDRPSLLNRMKLLISGWFR